MADLLFIFSTSPATFAGVCLVLGLLVGSFLNVVIHRLPIMMERDWQEQCQLLQGETPPPLPKYNLIAPRSACPHCGYQIRAIDNIPLISYFLLLRGRCKGCQASISIRYPLVELLTGLVSGYIGFRFGPGPLTAGALLFSWALIALTFIDFDKQLLPDDITLPLMWLGIFFNLNGWLGLPLKESIVGAMAGYLILWSVYWLFKLIRGKEGMGYGDFKLLAALGAWLGWLALPQIILISSVLGVIGGIITNIMAQRGLESRFAFGPYLAMAGMVSMLWGPEIAGLLGIRI
ncbi:leader peptidase (prepilin peptidase)/N-methyltransferase [Chitinivorax tropicus]|uniref:Prepilin leader peptidase/N-methyltransferase n=1 Tax=Chitinivorax tropicus TaxID=714531 RepID=A0A840MFD1_9PROT|nr:A24 family peptidase [Chitinivorax tropicus]MBB5017378.1 leader peptidase (prepilin peptidase)/N-methyltransferase [Chitinivorax tropicus]